MKVTVEKTGRVRERMFHNAAIAGICQIVQLLLGFINRTVFIKVLGAEYLGVGGLFSNILTMLSFAELGLGSALVYRLYAPVARQDHEKTRQYVRLYRTIYCVIAGVILACGFALAPFIPSIVKAPDVKENIVLLYLLYLLQSAASYVYVYKKSLLIAGEKMYVVNIYEQVSHFLLNLAQCLFLVVTRSFVLYCILKILFTLGNNFFCSRRAEREYPYINEKPEGELSREELGGLVKDAKGLLLTQIAGTAFGGTDNIFITVYLGIRYVGILAGYTTFLTMVNSIMNFIFNSVTATIGNLALTEGEGKTERALRKLFFLNTALYGYMCVGMALLLREFVTKIWLSEEYTLSQTVILLVLIELFLRGIHFPLYTIRNAMGCFSEHKVLFAGAAVLNIFLDFLWVRPWGIAGLCLSTILCRGICYMVDIWVVYREQFGKPVWDYLRMFAKWLAFLTVCGAISGGVLASLSLSGIWGFLVKVVGVTLIYFLLFFLVFSGTEEFLYFRETFFKKMEGGK